MALNYKLKIAVIGATGYTGLDLVYILSKHPKVKIEYLCATKKIGQNVKTIDKRIKRNLPKISSIKSVNWKLLDLVFLSLPNGEAQNIIKKTFRKYNNLKFIDLSADFRISNPVTYFRNYNINHKAKKLIKHSIYSISEFNKSKISKYRIISNPGCYPTSIQIALKPLISKNLIKCDEIIIDTKSGYSGAGKNFEKKFKHKNLYNSIYAYKIKEHRHVCEIQQELSKLTKKKVKFTFTPHLIPTFRGILSSIYVKPRNNVSAKKIRNVLLKFYKNSMFVKISKLNSQIGSGDVLNTNYCNISICETRFKNTILILSAIDNLVKGASGQAVQNMNILYKMPENLGLK